MDAKERLRRYLEQRRELGESELVLDGLPVDQVMAMLSTRPDAPRPRAPRPETGSEPPAADAGDASPVVHERPSDARPVGPADNVADAQEIRGANEDQREPLRDPEPRFDGNSSTDWRETLRRAGAMRPDAEKGKPSPKSGATPPEPDRTPSADDRPAFTLQPEAKAPAPAAPPAWLTDLGIPLGIASGGTSPRVLAPEIGALPTLDAIAEMVRVCTRCDLYKTAINPVPGEGNPDADFVCVGEAPGQNEDEQGRPFVGASGALLNKILGAIGLQRGDVFICNVLKHRPPGNRDPLPDEVIACEPYLRRQLELLRPRVILALGRFAAQSLLQTTTPIGKLRGQVHRYHGIPLIVTYHPAALLRNESWKRPTWEDVKLARRILDASRAASPS